MRRPKIISSQINEATEDLKGKKHTLHMKQLEFDVISNMDVNQINDILLNQNAFVQAQIKELYDDQEIPVRDIKIDPKSFPVRKPRSDDYYGKYLNTRKDIYQKMNQIEIKQLVEAFNYISRTRKTEGIDKKQEIHEKYEQLYWNFLQRQPEVEYNRRILLSELAECHEYLSALGNIPTNDKDKSPFDNPTIWNSEPLNEEEKASVDAIIDAKLHLIAHKYEFKDEDINNDHEDVLADVKDYLKKEYFNFQ